MTDKDKIRSVVARFFNVPETQVRDDFVFPPERLHGSVGRATFYAAIKRMAGADLPAALKAGTFGELFAPISAPTDGGILPSIATPAQTPGKLTGISVASDLAVGIDLDHTDNLPLASDPWTEQFYIENFTPAEIAYCQRQPNPRDSFCGIWCAKEALIKCSDNFRYCRPTELEVMHDSQGRPFPTVLRDGKSASILDCNLSISHSRGVSVAVVVIGSGRSGTSGSRDSGGQPVPGGFGGKSLSWLALGLSGLSLLLWLLVYFKK